MSINITSGAIVAPNCHFQQLFVCFDHSFTFDYYLELTSFLIQQTGNL